MTMRLLLAAAVLLAPAAPLHALQGGAPAPRAEDVASLDGIIAAYYEVVSGPAGERPDRARDESLHVPGARVGLVVRGPGAAPRLETMTLGEFHDRLGGVRDEPFHEWEVHRVTQRFGAIAHVWSTYVTSREPGGAPIERGINSIQLHFDGTRWWIAGWIFDAEGPDNPVPAEFLPPGEGS
jgi:hypothetical protein